MTSKILVLEMKVLISTISFLF